MIKENFQLICTTAAIGFVLTFPLIKYTFASDPKDSGEARRRLKNVPKRSVVPDGVALEESYIQNTRGMVLYTQRFKPVGVKPKGVIFLCHGYAETTLWFFRDIALDYVKEGYACVGIDYEGHGKSDGLHTYIPDFHQMVSDVASFFESVQKEEEFEGLPFFLHGESMGGAVAIELSLRNPGAYTGMVLQAPMCKIGDKIKPPGFVISILRRAANWFPERAWTPSADVNPNAFSQPEKLKEAMTGPWAYTRKPRMRTAVVLLGFSEDLESRLGGVTIPFIICHGAADRVTDPEVSEALFNKAKSTDKTFNKYEGMWHSLLNEPEANKRKVWNDIIAWVNKRATDNIKSA